jgi:uncharacterized protein involved in exopolysaccharide biosynthesis
MGTVNDTSRGSYKSMDDRPVKNSMEREIYIGALFSLFPKIWWRAGLISLAVGAITFIALLQMPNIYQAKATITPVADEGKQSSSFALGAIASMGLSIGGPTKVEDLEELFRSNDLAARVFRKYDLWAIVLGDRFDVPSGTIKPSLGDRLSRNENGARPPGDWDAIRVAKKRLKIFTNKKAGTIVLSIDSLSAEGSANIVKHYLEEGKSRLQEEALSRAGVNKKFIQEQISKTVDPVTRDRLYALYGQEVEREMMAHNREQFGFKVVDSPRVPDRKSEPHRFLTSLLAALLSFVVSSVLLAAWPKRRTTD